MTGASTAMRQRPRSERTIPNNPPLCAALRGHETISILTQQSALQHTAFPAGITRVQQVGCSKNTSPTTVKRLMARAQQMHAHNQGIWYGYQGMLLCQDGEGCQLLAWFNK